MKGSQPQVVTSRPDAQSQSYIDQQRQAARSFFGQNTYGGADPNLTGALRGFQGYADQGAAGSAALSGDPAAAARFMNPYTATLNPIWDKLTAQAGREADQAATRQGIFGGSRSDIARSTATSNVRNAQAGSNVQAFNDAMSRAAQSANFGFGANQQLFSGGQYLQFLPQLFQQMQLGLLDQGRGPVGQTQETQMSSSPFQQLLGGALSLAPFLFPGAGGAAAGAASGFLPKSSAPSFPAFGSSGLNARPY